MQRFCPLGSFRFCCCQNSVLQFYRNAGILILPEWFDVKCCECAVCCGRDVSRAPVFFYSETLIFARCRGSLFVLPARTFLKIAAQDRMFFNLPNDTPTLTPIQSCAIMVVPRAPDGMLFMRDAIDDVHAKKRVSPLQTSHNPFD